MNAVHPKLDSLTTDEFALRFGLISNPQAIHRCLQTSAEVDVIRSALRDGEITEQSIRSFIAELLRQHVPGQLFVHDIALAAIAVSLETRASSFACEVIGDLARLELAELPIAIRVARRAVPVQLGLTGNKTQVVTFPPEGEQPTGWQLKPQLHPVEVGQIAMEFELELT